MRPTRLPPAAALLLAWLLSPPPLAAQDRAAPAPKPAEQPAAEKAPAGPAEPAEFDQARADAETLKEAGIADEGPALLDYFRRRTVGDDQRKKILALIGQMGHDSFDLREEATEQVEAFGLAAVGLLRQAERGEDVEIALRAERCLRSIEKVPSAALSAAAARRLAHHRPDGTAEVLLAYLPSADDESAADTVRDALAAVAREGGKPNPALVRALGAESPLLRGAAAEALVRGGAEDLFPRLRKMLAAETDPDLRARLALALVTAAKQKDVVPQMIALLGETSLDRGWRIEEVLWNLAGEKGPPVSLGDDARSRERCRDAWMDWWRANGERIDLAALDQGPRMLGYTMVLAVVNGNVNGRVLELDADKKERWRFEGVQFPISAQVLPGNKILLAEHNRHQVTERDQKGTILWRQHVLMPVAVQRLPNGHIFIAARNQFYEFDRKRREVWRYQRPQYDVVAAQRLRNGEVVFATNSGLCVRIDPSGKELKSFSVGQTNYHSGIDVLPNNRVLVTRVNDVAEFDLATGKPTGWSVEVRTPSSVQRLPNGHTLVTSMGDGKVLELDRQGKSRWEYTPENNARPWAAVRR